MNDDQPFPPALPAVFQSPIGPAISYSGIRAVTSRAESLLDGLDKKVRKRLNNGLDAAGQVGAKLETKVLSRLADQLTPPEQIFNDTTELLQNQIAANMAPAVATLEDLTQAPVGLPGGSLSPATALPVGEGAVASRVHPPQITPQVAPSRATVTAGGRVSPGGPQAAGGTLLQQRRLPPPPVTLKGDCSTPSAQDQQLMQDWANAIAQNTPPSYPTDNEGILGNWWSLSDQCCIDGPVRAPGDLPVGKDAHHWIIGITGTITQAQAGINAVLAQWNKQNKKCTTTPPVDCTIHPEDPSCPPPHNGGPPTCPPPCIDVDVTCPPPVINVPPCPPFNLPTCVQIDLCDWDKFCKALKDCLVKAKEDCALDNDTAYLYKDCDGSFNQALTDWYGQAGAVVAEPASYDDLIATAEASLPADNPLWFLGPEPIVELTT